MSKRNLLLIVATAMGLSFSHAIQPEELDRSAQARFENRLNELMLWRLSDELGLKPQDEQQLKSILRKYQEQRKNALGQQEQLLTKMSNGVKASAANCTACLGDYEKTVASVADANTKEFKELRGLLGAEKMQKFLVIRSQMTKDVRDALRQPATPTAAPKK